MNVDGKVDIRVSLRVNLRTLGKAQFFVSSVFFATLLCFPLDELFDCFVFYSCVRLVWHICLFYFRYYRSEIVSNKDKEPTQT